PGRHSPGYTHLIGRRPTGEEAKSNPDDRIYETYDYRGSEPRRAIGCIHLRGLIQLTVLVLLVTLPALTLNIQRSTGRRQKIQQGGKLAQAPVESSERIPELRHTLIVA